MEPERNEYESVFLVGLSWGGKLALAYGLTHPDDVDGLVLITPGIRALVDVDVFTKVGIFVSSWLQPTTPFATPIEPEMFTRTPRFLAYVEDDPLRLKFVSARFLIENRRLDGYIDREMPQLRLPVQLFLAGQDSIIDNAGVHKVLRRGQAALDVRVYEDQTHSIQFDAPHRLVRDMVDWLRRRRR